VAGAIRASHQGGAVPLELLGERVHLLEVHTGCWTPGMRKARLPVCPRSPGLATRQNTHGAQLVFILAA
jgi:hypothetical protein